MPPFRLDGKSAIVTGAASGIGENIAKVFAEQGANVYVLDINDELGESVVNEINSDGGYAKYFNCDVTSLVKVRSVFRSVYEEHGAIDILVNNAGISQIGNVEATTPELLDKVYNVNVKAVYHCLHEGVKLMKTQEGGVILNLASIASVIALKDRFGYSMTKAAVLAMTLSMAKDYIDDNIRCNAIGPARVHTPFVDDYIKTNYPGKEEEMFKALSATQPIGRMGKPREIAHLALYLCSDEASFVTGSFYPIDGGFINLNT